MLTTFERPQQHDPPDNGKTCAGDSYACNTFKRLKKLEEGDLEGIPIVTSRT